MIENAKIDKILTARDSTEIVLEKIGSILKIEIENQKALLKEAEIEDKDFNISVFVENASAWQIQTEEDEESPVPVINVTFDRYNTDGEDGTDSRLRKATFFIDCYACGNFGGEGFASRTAKVKSLKVARIARNILEAAVYRYLDMRGLVIEKHIVSMTAGASPPNESSIFVACERIDFEVTYYEDAPQMNGEEMDGMGFTSLSPDGEVLINI